MTPEEKATQGVRLEASLLGIKLFRNNSGVLMNPIGIPVRFGLGNESKKLNGKFKSSDFIGIKKIKITADMVGSDIGVFCAIEVKPEGFVEQKEYFNDSREYAQKKFIDLIKSNGGLAGFATSESSVQFLFNKYIVALRSILK